MRKKSIEVRIAKLSADLATVKEVIGKKSGDSFKKVVGNRLHKRDDERRWAKQYMKAKDNYQPITFTQAIDQELAKQKIAVRLDHRTVIFVTPGADIRVISNHINQQHISI